MKRFAELLLNHRLLILAFLGVITVSFLYFLSSLRINEDFDKIFLEHDPGFEFFERFLEEFGHDEIVVVAIQVDHMLNEKNLSFMKKLEKKLSQLEHISKIFSLTSATDVLSNGNEIKLMKIVDKFPETKEERDNLERKIRSHPFYFKTLVSEDFRVGAIHLKLDKGIGGRVAREELIAKIWRETSTLKKEMVVLRDRKFYEKGGSFSFSAYYIYISAMILNNPLCDRQPQTGTGMSFVLCKKGGKDF